MAFVSRHIKKVWEVDPLECPKCHAEMKIISFISKSQPEPIHGQGRLTFLQMSAMRTVYLSFLSTQNNVLLNVGLVRTL